jgi:hypothetical protein
MASHVSANPTIVVVSWTRLRLVAQRKALRPGNGKSVVGALAKGEIDGGKGAGGVWASQSRRQRRLSSVCIVLSYIGDKCGSKSDQPSPDCPESNTPGIVE